jgi:hypothetical protein
MNIPSVWNRQKRSNSKHESENNLLAQNEKNQEEPQSGVKLSKSCNQLSRPQTVPHPKLTASEDSSSETLERQFSNATQLTQEVTGTTFSPTATLLEERKT